MVMMVVVVVVVVVAMTMFLMAPPVIATTIIHVRVHGSQFGRRQRLRGPRQGTQKHSETQDAGGQNYFQHGGSLSGSVSRPARTRGDGVEDQVGSVADLTICCGHRRWSERRPRQIHAMK